MKTKPQKKPALKRLLFPCALLLLFNSCIGLSMDIQMQRDGSGKLVVEYRVSRLLESLGGLDGNENMPTIPIGRADWERTIARIPGMRLASYSRTETDSDTIIKTTLEFDNSQALLSFLDPTGTKASLTLENQTNILNLILLQLGTSERSEEYGEEVMSMARQMFDGYNISISFSAQGNSSLSFFDGEGTVATPPNTAQIVTSGRKTSFSIGIMDAIELTEGFGVRFIW